MLNNNDCLQERYRVVKLLAEGGMSYVYLALDLKLHQRYVVLKQLKPVFQSSSQLIHKEAEAIIKLKHSHLPQLYDLFWHDQVGYIMVMEYIEGKTLDEITWLTDESKVNVLYQLAKVMMYLHERPLPMFHGDLKPQNIMLDEKFHIKLLDFATSGYRQMNSNLSKSLYEGSMYATKTYAAPERLNGAAISMQSDVYSYGIVVLSLWQKEAAFIQQHYASVEQYCLKELNDLPHPLVNLLSYILQPNPLHRKYTFREMVAVLEHVINSDELDVKHVVSIEHPKRVAVLNLNRCAGATTVAVALAEQTAHAGASVSMIEIGYEHSNMMMSHIASYPKRTSVLPHYDCCSSQHVDYYYASLIEAFCDQSPSEQALDDMMKKVKTDVVIFDFSSINERFKWIERLPLFDSLVVVSTDDIFLLNSNEALNCLNVIGKGDKQTIIHIHNHCTTLLRQSFLDEYAEIAQFVSIPFYADKKKRGIAFKQKWLHPKSDLFNHVNEYMAKLILIDWIRN